MIINNYSPISLAENTKKHHGIAGNNATNHAANVGFFDTDREFHIANVIAK